MDNAKESLDYSIFFLYIIPRFSPCFLCVFSIHLTLTKGRPKRARTKTPPLRSRLGETCARAHINKTHYDQTNNEASISKCQGATKSMQKASLYRTAVAARPEQSPVELHLHVFTEWATLVHRVQSETLRPPSTFETLKRMQRRKNHHPPTSARHDARCTWCRTAADVLPEIS